ncbi:S24 family peptidase [Zymobacter palmae]|uniref:S24 family peptidase n=1 Tax=Zymobacter palmae TaxID=33074 RepID=UPI00047FC5D1|nr:S24 family peptidase [Zymobacter palmae]
MITVRYVAPLKRTEMRADHTCGIDPYAMLSPRQGSLAYVVEVERDWKEAGIQEGDQLVVDENLYPRSGDICVFAGDDCLSIRFVCEKNGELWPVGRDKEELYRIAFGGTVTQLVRCFRE